MTLTIELSDGEIKQFERYAALLGGDKERYIRQALLEKLEEIEDYLEAKKRLEDPAASYVSLEEAERELGLEN